MAADTQDSVLEHLGAIQLELPLALVQLEGGDMIIRLSNKPEDILIVHSQVLAAASERFEMRFGKEWQKVNANTATHIRTKESMSVYKYKLLYDDRTFTISDEDKQMELPEEEFVEDGFSTGKPTVPTFHHSNLASGFPKKKYDGSFSGSPCRTFLPMIVTQELENSIRAHKIVFAFLYQQPVNLADQPMQDIVLDVCNVIALAEYYDFLPAIAADIENVLVELPSIWQDVAFEPTVYMAMAIKLRSKQLFTDAVRHFVGQGQPAKDLVREDILNADEVLDIILPAQECHRRRAASLEKELRRLTLTPYQAHAYAFFRRDRGPEVRTTWLAGSFEQKTLQDKCNYLAQSAFREWLDQQLNTSSHWSHIKHAQTTPKDGQVKIGTFRQTCEVFTAAQKKKYNVDALGARLASKFATIFNLEQEKGEKHPAALITYYLKGYIRQAAFQVMRHYPRPNEENWDTPYCHVHHSSSFCVEAAKHDAVDYWTLTAVEKDLMPWSDLPEWVEFVMPVNILTEASQEWMERVCAV